MFLVKWNPHIFPYFSIVFLYYRGGSADILKIPCLVFTSCDFILDLPNGGGLNLEHSKFFTMTSQFHHSLLVGGWATPLKNDGLRQLGWFFHSQLNGKSSNSCSKPPTIHYIPMLGYVLWYFLGYFGLPWWTYHGYPAAAHWKLLELRHVGTQLLVQLSHLGQQLPSQVLLTSASEG